MSPPAGGSPFTKWQRAWTSWVEGVGLDVVWTKQADNPPEHRKPYARLDIVSKSVVGTDEQSQIFSVEAQAMHRVLRGVRQIVVNVQVISNAKPELGESAWAWIDEIEAVLQTDEVSAAFKAAGLAVMGVGQAVDLGQLEQSQYVSRVSLDVTFEAAFYRVSPSAGGWINEIVGSGDLEGNSTPEITFDVEGP